MSTTPASINPTPAGAKLNWKTLIGFENVPLPTPPTLTEKVNEAVTGFLMIPKGVVLMFAVSPVPVSVSTSPLGKLVPANEPLTVADSV